jgi:hypothetical protein
MNYNKHKNSQTDNGHSPLFNQLFGSAVNFVLKWIIALIGGNKAAKHSGRLRFRLTKWIGSKAINWK